VFRGNSSADIFHKGDAPLYQERLTVVGCTRGSD
jgi:hypothetical protein